MANKPARYETFMRTLGRTGRATRRPNHDTMGPASPRITTETWAFQVVYASVPAPEFGGCGSGLGFGVAGTYATAPAAQALILSRGRSISQAACLGLLAVAMIGVPAHAQRGVTIPPPRGLVNDFAGVIPADRANQIEAIVQYVRDRSGGEIAIVTLPDLAGRDVGDVALQIGREWKVGAKAAVGDARDRKSVV